MEKGVSDPQVVTRQNSSDGLQRRRPSNVQTRSSFSEDNPGMPAEPVSKCDKFMQCFSALDNINKLTTPRSKKGDSELEVLNGVRFLSCVFVIMGNVFLFTLRSPL